MTVLPRTTTARCAARRCTGCGRGPAELAAGLPVGQRRRAAQDAAADLEVVWLTPNGRAGFVESWFCRGCAPAGAVVDLGCAVCQAGPLLQVSQTPPLPGMPTDTTVTTRAAGWLRRPGWREMPGGVLVCPSCS